MIAKSNQKLSMQKLHKQGWKINSLFGCIPLRWSGSGSVIRDHTDHGRSNEPMNPLPEWIHQFIWSTMILVISDHWSQSGSSQSNAPFDKDKAPNSFCNILNAIMLWGRENHPAVWNTLSLLLHMYWQQTCWKTCTVIFVLNVNLDRQSVVFKHFINM